MKPLTSSVFSFEKLRQDGYLYVDKTEYLWKLIQHGGESYFLSRPRRFGKSLTVSTLKAIFEGRKDLFEGLAIFDKPYAWKKFPVIHLDFGNCNTNNADELCGYLGALLDDQAARFHCRLANTQANLAIAFERLLNEVAGNGQVVLLIDEYDKPILNTLTKPEAQETLEVLRGFYSTIKKCNAVERFVFLTGVSKFSHVSIFSNLNNLTDITMDERFATMLGYTQEELEANFPDYLEQAATNNNLSLEDCKSKVREWYNGFRFEEGAPTVYNPVSIARFFEQGGKFRNYWFSTGTPTFLLDLMKNKNYDLEAAVTQPVSGFAFDAYEVDRINSLALLLQTGYLTIARTEPYYSKTNYYLRFPNLEVQGSFQTFLASNYSGCNVDAVDSTVNHLLDAVATGDVNGFMETMKIFFAKVPYDLHLKSENNFHVLFFAIFTLLGINITAESRTNNGRIDAVAENAGFVFIFEFKLNKSEVVALEQIKERDYYRRYVNSRKKITLIGANFDLESGQITGWTSEEV